MKIIKQYNLRLLLLLIIIGYYSTLYGEKYIGLYGPVTQSMSGYLVDIGAENIVHWSGSNVRWMLNSTGAGDGLTFSSTQGAVENGFSSWENVSTADIGFTFVGSTSCTWSYDGDNVIYWAESGDPIFNYIGSGALAVTVISINASEEFTDVDIVFNGRDFVWNVNNLDYDIEAVATHEIGHMIGLHHTDVTSNPLPTMYAYYQGIDGRSLEWDDQIGVSFLYRGNLIDNKTLSGTNYVNWDWKVESGKTLTIQSGATVNLNNYSIVSTGGTIDNQGSFNGLTTYLKSGSTILGYCANVQGALSYASSGQTIEAISSHSVNSSCSVPSGATLSVSSGVTLTLSSNVRLSVSGALSASGTTFQGNGTAGSWNSISFDANSSGTIQSSTIKDAQCGIYATTGASVTSSGNTITNNSLYGLSIINSGSVDISDCTISYNGTGINLYGSTAGISGSSILNNTNYGIDAENVSCSSPWEDNTLEGNDGYAIVLNNTSPVLLSNMITDNGHGIIITSSDPSFGYRAGGSGYNAITCAATPLFKAENYSDVYAGSDGGGYNSIFGSEAPDMEAVNNSSVDAENNYWGSSNPATYADGTSWIDAANPLSTDPNPGSSCMGKISASNKIYADNVSVKDEDISNIYRQAISAGKNKDFKTAKDLLKSIINGKFDKKYSPLSLLSFNNFSVQEKQAQDSSIKPMTPTNEYKDLIKELYDRPLADSLRPFAVRLLARWAALSSKFTDMVTYNTEVVTNYQNSSNELAALYDLVGYYNEIENDVEKAKGYLTRMKAAYPDEDLTLFAQINLGEKVDINNRKINIGNATETPKEISLNNYPNPFNPTTMITYNLKEKDHVTLIVFDILGKEVAKLVDGMQTEGEYSINFDGSDLPSGMYIYQLKGSNFNLSKKMLLLK